MTDEEKIRQVKNAYARKYSKNNPEKIKAYKNRHYLKKFNELNEAASPDEATISNEDATPTATITATPATPATLDNQIIELKQEEPTISNREIARRLGTNDNKVRRVLKANLKE